MRKYSTALIVASVFLASVVASAVYGESRDDSMMGYGMMGNGRGMMGMMKMMNECSNMMHNARPNDQWRKNTPSEPEKKN
jgi:hypothetical protein